MYKIENRRDIIDRRTLGAELAALAEGGDTRAPAFRAKVLALLKDCLKGGQDEVKRRFEVDDATGLGTARSICYLVDQILRTAYDFTISHVYPAHNPTSGERLAGLNAPRNRPWLARP